MASSGMTFTLDEIRAGREKVAKGKFKVKLKSERKFLEPFKESDSYYRITVGTGKYEEGEVDIKLADCYRTINWNFGKPGDKRAIAKITVVKQMVDKVYDFLTQEVEK